MTLRFSSAVLSGIAGVAAFACPAFAQVVTLDIPAQDLRNALDEYIKAVNVQLVYRVDDLAGLKSHAVQGTMDLSSALDRLLEGTGIAVHRDPTGAVVISRQISRVDPAAPALPDAGPVVAEMVTVTGYRASLQKALLQKRDSVGMRDSVLAEDIGKYPARNVAESLARVPGVVIARDTRTDEGKSVIVRGLDASFTIVTINGNPVRMVTGTSVGSNNRSVDLDAFGADIFSRVDFYKSPLATLDEGGIGGVIDMRTPHPFDYDEDKIAYSVGYSLNTYRDKAMPRGSIQASGTLGYFGGLIAFTASETAYQLMGSEVPGWGQSRNDVGTDVINTTLDFGSANDGFDPRANIGIYSVNQLQQAYIPRFISREHLELEDRTRYSGVVSLQYKTNDLDVSFDLLVANLIDKRSEYTLGPYFRSTATTAAGWAGCQSGAIPIGTIGCSGIVPLAVAIDADNNLYGTFANMGWIDENRWYDGNDKYLSGTFAARYAPTDSFKLNAVASIGDSRSFYSDDRIYFSIFNTTVRYDPTVNYQFPEVTTSTNLTDVSQFSAPSVDANFYREGDRVVTGKLSGSDTVVTGFVPFANVVFEAGISWVSSQKNSDRKSNGAAVMAEAQYNGQSFSSLTAAQYVSPGLPISNFLEGIDHGSRVMSWATIPRRFYQALDMNGILARHASVYSGVFNVTEAIEAAYVQVDTRGRLFGRELRVNAGLRYALSRLWGYNYDSMIGGADQTVYTKAGLTNKYDSLLPSFSIAYDIATDVVLRAAYGRTITRPSLGSIAQGTTIPSRFNAAASSGDPKLKPLQAQNLDLAAEWYFMPDALLSAGVYYKSLKDLISIQTGTVPFSALNLPWSSFDPAVFGTIENPNLPIQLSHPVNLNPMVVKGVEAFYQQSYGFLPAPFDSMGTLISFTYTAGAAGGPGTGFVANDGSVFKKQITGMSKYTFSGTAFYEKAPYNIRLSYNWRSATPAEDGNHNGTDLRLWNKARGSLDGTIAYDLNDYLELRLDGTNLLNASEIQYVTDGTQDHSHLSVGRGKDTNRVDIDYLHGSTFVLSVRGRL